MVVGTVRPFNWESKSDLNQIVDIYISAFANPDWNEFLKCAKCGTNYGRSEIKTGAGFDERCGSIKEIKYAYPKASLVCKGNDCGVYLGPSDPSPRRSPRTSTYLVPYWTKEDVVADLNFAKSQKDTIVLVAEENDKIVGFIWGYKIPFEKFGFLSGLVNENSSYVDEVAVKPDKWRKGVGSALCLDYLKAAKAQEMEEVTLRTLESFKASMGLFRKNGFGPVLSEQNNKVYDPTYPDRIYLRRKI